MLYFLPEDFVALNDEIDGVIEKIREYGKEIGRSCKEGAETFHDNFGFEDAERNQQMWSKRLRDLISLRNSAHVVKANPSTEKVSLGRTVTFKDLSTDEIKTYLIGSYMLFGKNRVPTVISYNSPIGRLLLSGKVGEIRSGTINKREREFEILKIE